VAHVEAFRAVLTSPYLPSPQNGSTIRSWWLVHHYISALMSVIVLTWPPDSVSWDLFTPTFTAFFWYQGAVQFTQAWYQRRRHYVLRAMGKARAMDVSHTETLTEFHAGLYTIVALVFVAQAWQLWIGWALLQTLVFELDVSQPWYDFREEVQAGMLGVCFIALGLANFVVTVQTLVSKRGRSGSEGTAPEPSSRGTSRGGSPTPLPTTPMGAPGSLSRTPSLSIATPGKGMAHSSSGTAMSAAGEGSGGDSARSPQPVASGGAAGRRDFAAGGASPLPVGTPGAVPAMPGGLTRSTSDATALGASSGTGGGVVRRTTAGPLGEGREASSPVGGDPEGSRGAKEE
jgi:hypothetical protein